MLKIGINPKQVNYDIPQGNVPLKSLLEVQALLDSAFRAILKQHGLSDEEGAHAAAISTAVLIDKTKGVLSPQVAYAIAVDGLVAGSKTVPSNAERSDAAAR